MVELLGLSGVLASPLGLALTAYGVFYNGRATRALMEHNTRRAEELIQQQGRATRELVEAIRTDIRAMQDDAQRRHEDLLAFLKEMDRRHTELMGEIARRP